MIVMSFMSAHSEGEVRTGSCPADMLAVVYLRCRKIQQESEKGEKLDKFP